MIGSGSDVMGLARIPTFGSMIRSGKRARIETLDPAADPIHGTGGRTILGIVTVD
jgi:hypothetical protein